MPKYYIAEFKYCAGDFECTEFEYFKANSWEDVRQQIVNRLSSYRFPEDYGDEWRVFELGVGTTFNFSKLKRELRIINEQKRLEASQKATEDRERKEYERLKAKFGG